jgi:hypothetical protein
MWRTKKKKDGTLATTSISPVVYFQLSGETKPEALVPCILTNRIGSRELVTCKGVPDPSKTPLLNRLTGLQMEFHCLHCDIVCLKTS